MSSVNGVVDAANTAFSAGIIVAIVIGSVIGLGILICIIICLYCVCCRPKKTTYPGAVIQAPPYSGPQAPPYGGPGYYNQPMNNV